MATQYDWQFINPLDQTANILAMNQGNQSVRAGLQGIADSVVGYANDIKQRNTDDILNQLYQAKTTAELPTAMNAVNALQRQYGRGYDQAAIRNAIDSRGAALGQRDLQNINLQQAQRAQDAIPQVNAMAAAFAAGRKGVTPGMAAQLQQAADMGIDASNLISNLASTAQSDYTAERTFTTGRADRAEDASWRTTQANQAQNNWQADFDARQDNTNWNRAGDISKENPASFGYSTDSTGNPITVSNSGITRMDAYGALSGVRGIRNNNPGNLGFANQKGASRENGSGRFAAFNTPEEGLAAMSKQLDLYYTGKSNNVTGPAQSVSAIISAWAPDNENDTKAYISQVAKELNVSPTAKLNLNDPSTKMALMQAIVKKENGGNPYTLKQYQAGVAGKVGTASQAVANIGGGVVPQANMSKVSTDYQNAITKLSTDYGVQQTKDQIKGAVAATGKNVDTWVTSKKESSWTGNSTNPMVTEAGDIGAMAREDSAFTSLPQDAQIKILEGAYGYLRNSGTFERVPNKSIRDFIHKEATATKQGKVDQFNKQKEAVFQGAYQAMVQQYQQAGVAPPSIEGARKLLDPKAAVQTKQAPVTTNAAAQKAMDAVQPKQTQPTKTTSEPDYVVQRNARKAAQLADAEKRIATQKAKDTAKKAKDTVPFAAGAVRVGTTNMSQQQLEEVLKKYKIKSLP